MYEYLVKIKIAKNKDTYDGILICYIEIKMKLQIYIIKINSFSLLLQKYLQCPD